jgi:sulfur carrier protein ThiS
MKMKIKIKAFGEARKHIPGYEPESGIELESFSGLIIKDLLLHLNIPMDKGIAVSMDGRIVGPDIEIPDNATIVLLNPLAGG